MPLSSSLPMNMLHSIIANKKREIEMRKLDVPLNALAQKLDSSTRSFKDAIQGRTKNKLNLIAEIKKASPSEGVLRPNIEDELAEIAAVYNRHASAISVVTDAKFFHGSLEWIKKIRPLTRLPILCKDFIIDEYQLYEARAYGADAALLIANKELRIANYELRNYIATAQKLGMSALVEVHNRKELDYALANGAEIVGINNRDLATFSVSLETTLQLAKLIPKNIITVSESGFKTLNNVKKARGIVDAALIGTTFMRSHDIEEKLRELGFAN